LFEVSGSDLLREPKLAEEIFGPTALVIRYKDRAELLALAQSLEGQLTATLHGTEADILARPIWLRFSNARREGCW
jgi:alpha-ketoglutaric semialdehyde dehydrogenase